MPKPGDVARKSCDNYSSGADCGGQVVWVRRSIPDPSAGQDFPVLEQIAEWRCERCGQVHPDNFDAEGSAS
jgi:hypothetical protein